MVRSGGPPSIPLRLLPAAAAVAQLCPPPPPPPADGDAAATPSNATAAVCPRPRGATTASVAAALGLPRRDAAAVMRALAAAGAVAARISEAGAALVGAHGAFRLEYPRARCPRCGGARLALKRRLRAAVLTA